MGWWSSLFTPSESSQRSRRGQALSSTDEAFALPTSSTGFVSSHPDAFNPELLSMQDPETAGSSSSFTYPPQSSMAKGSYGYIPTFTASRSNTRQASLLPLHNSPSSPNLPYPPLAQTWGRLRVWLAREYPELGDTLAYGVLPQDYAQLEMQFGFALPAAVRESYLVVDGQEPESAAGCSEGLFFGCKLLPLEDVLEEWRFWREVDDDPSTGANVQLRETMDSIPSGWVRKEYSLRGWIPLIADKAGNYIGVDMNPGEGGAVGQVIVFGRDFDTKVVLWRGDGMHGWAKWLASFAEELESGEGYELGGTNESEGSEDSVGYESYFYDGTGRGQGDGGGESGAAGLRLAGEYRGWPVFEAWADRSVRKWHEAGVVPAAAVVAPDDKPGKTKSEKHGLGVLDLAAAAGGSTSAEVPIPVVAASPESGSPPALNNVTNMSIRHTELPTISVTKPPAPMPLDVPTAHDIAGLPSPPDSAHSSDVENDIDTDLESGGRVVMREILHENQPLTAPRKYSPSRNVQSPASPSVLQNHPLVPVTPAETKEMSVAPIPPPAQGQAMSDITDLLVEPAPVLGATPITPSSSSGSNSRSLDSSPAQPSEPSSQVEEAASEVEPDTTVRLVGGGGSAGVVEQESAWDDKVPPEAELDGARAVSSPSPNSVSSASASKHEKKKSSISSGLKKFSQIGGRRRNQSSSSILSTKDAVA